MSPLQQCLSNTKAGLRLGIGKPEGNYPVAVSNEQRTVRVMWGVRDMYTRIDE